MWRVLKTRRDDTLRRLRRRRGMGSAFPIKSAEPALMVLREIRHHQVYRIERRQKPNVLARLLRRLRAFATHYVH
jgi:hypothetical protein